MTTEQIQKANAQAIEVEKFDQLSDEWWDETGPLATLHAINPLRTDYIAARSQLDGARVLDVGCGAGILSESLARLGAQVTAIDLAAENIRVAREHATQQGLEIDYRVDSVEAIAAAHDSDNQ